MFDVLMPATMRALLLMLLLVGFDVLMSATMRALLLMVLVGVDV